MKILDAFSLSAELAFKRNNNQVLKGKLHEVAVNDQWKYWLNATHDDQKTSSGVTVKPSHIYIEYNGWPAGILNYREGEIAAGEKANEESFVSALKEGLGKGKEGG